MDDDAYPNENRICSGLVQHGREAQSNLKPTYIHNITSGVPSIPGLAQQQRQRGGQCDVAVEGNGGRARDGQHDATGIMGWAWRYAELGVEDRRGDQGSAASATDRATGGVGCRME
jgi:hypothetical protein